MRRSLSFAAEELLPSQGAVLRTQGVPAGAPVSERIASLVRRAGEVFLEIARPRAVVAEIDVSELAKIYESAVTEPEATPLGLVYPRADALALFALTLGQEMGDEITRLFAIQELALAVMLDGVASEAAERAVALLERRRAAELAGGPTVLAYSPGYCGWPVEGQRALFAALGPEAIGITLTESCVMVPLKSVSGVLVAAERAVHRHGRELECCAGCESPECRARLAGG